MNAYILEKGFNLYIHMNELGLNLYRNINEPHGCSASVSVCVYICVAALNTSHAVAAPCAAPGAAIWGPASQRLTEALVRVRHGVAAVQVECPAAPGALVAAVGPDRGQAAGARHLPVF